MHSHPDEATIRTLEGVLASEPDVRFAYLFGSAAEGGMGPRSDVDVAEGILPELLRTAGKSWICCRISRRTSR